DPGLDVGDLLLRELLLRRHLEVVVGPAQRLDQEALRGVARDDRGAGVAALQHPLARIEIEAALQLRRLRAVAGRAALRQNRPDLLLEELEALRVGRFLTLQEAREQQQDGGAADHFAAPRSSLTTSLSVAFFRNRMAKRVSQVGLQRFAPPYQEPSAFCAPRMWFAPSRYQSCLPTRTVS